MKLGLLESGIWEGAESPEAIKRIYCDYLRLESLNGRELES